MTTQNMICTLMPGDKVMITDEHLAAYGSLYRPHDSDVWTVDGWFHGGVFEISSGRIKRRMIHAKNLRRIESEGE